MAFSPSSSFSGSRIGTTVKSSSSQMSMFFGPKKDDGTPGDYVCKVRTYIRISCYTLNECYVLWCFCFRKNSVCSSRLTTSHVLTNAFLHFFKFFIFFLLMSFVFLYRIVDMSLPRDHRLGLPWMISTSVHPVEHQSFDSIRSPREVQVEKWT
jgi:hypothetical protein